MNIFSYTARKIKIADWVSVAIQLTLRYGDYSDLYRYAPCYYKCPLNVERRDRKLETGQI